VIEGSDRIMRGLIGVAIGLVVAWTPAVADEKTIDYFCAERHAGEILWFDNEKTVFARPVEPLRFKMTFKSKTKRTIKYTNFHTAFELQCEETEQPTTNYHYCHDGGGTYVFVPGLFTYTKIIGLPLPRTPRIPRVEVRHGTCDRL
jgi:hypothetical protein